MQNPQLIVLVIDDSDAVRDFVGKTLESLGCMVFTATNGAEAVQLASKGFAQIILMDLFMPVMDGLEATRAIRAAERERRKSRSMIVAMSSAPEEEKCREAGIDEFLVKPVTQEELVSLLKRYTSSQSEDSRQPVNGGL